MSYSIPKYKEGEIFKSFLVGWGMRLSQEGANLTPNHVVDIKMSLCLYVILSLVS